ncbi:MAG: hypothetical protein NE327_01400, partial [Lentisphaeraceae bacterium]|nr:hypothetical protein [Lentisphaeraceae bacterium]
MSSESSSTKNPLQREGTSQRARMPESLDPLFAKLDDRDLYDYLDFVYKYSEIVRFHSSEGLEKGDDDAKLNWQIFFSCGIILLSHISRNSSTESNRIFRADLRKLDDLNAKAESLKIEQSLLAYFDKLTLWKSKFSHNDPFKEVIGKIIDDSYFDSLKDSLSKNREKFLDSDYGLEELTQNYLYINSEIIRYFDGLVIEAEKELQLRLANDKFTPHIGLLLSFLELFEKSRNKLNEMTGRHLRFYYEDILQTERKAYVEDEANILVELAKNHDEHLLTQGTLFKGGKDSEGNERLYELTEDFIANTNYVSAVKSSFVDGDIVRAAENSMTLDGIEEALPEEDPVWAPFNNTEYPTARLGFAISSPLLRLETGIKSITLSFFFDSLSDLSEITATDFEVFYSSKSKWVNAELADAKPDESAFVFTLNIPATADPVCDYSALNMEDSENFDTNWPVFKFVLKEEAHSKRKYLLDKNISHWTLSTTVSDIRDSIIQNDLGKLKVEKPFMPFGPQPVKGSQFYIGHPEIFSKKLDSLTLNWDWLDAPTNLEDYYSKYSDNKPEFKVDASVLKDKSWTDPSTKNISADKALLSSLSLSIKDDTSFSDAETLKDFSADLEKGFLRLKLSAPNMAFGHKEYPKIQQNAVIQASSTNDDTRKLGMDILENLNLPYTPTWENLRISYDSSLDSTEDSDLMKLFSLEEFGHVPEPKFLVSEYNEKARLFIGLKNVDEGSSVSLLIQFADGTADPFSA